MTYSSNSTGPWNIQTLDTRLQFELRNGTPVLSEISSLDSPEYKWVNNSPEFILPNSTSYNWKYDGVLIEDRKISFKYSCIDPCLEVISIWESQDLHGPVEHSVFLTNNSDNAIIFHPSQTINLSLNLKPGHTLENWWIEKISGGPSDTGTHTDLLAPGYKKLLRSGPYSHHETRDDITWFYIQDTTAKFGIYGGVEFSGWTQVLTEVSDSINVSYGLHAGEGKTRTSLDPSATFEFPTCFVGVCKGEVDDGCNRLHHWVEKHLRPAIPFGITPMLVNNSWGSDMAITEEIAIRMIDDCAKLGIEIFHMDAGWFKEVGDWHTHRGKFPKGLNYIVDYTHSKGLKFGLWVGWTQGGSLKEYSPDVLSVFNPEQKDWFMYDFPPEYNNSEFAGGELCLGSPEGKEWCLNELRRLIKKYELDLLEHDQRMVVDACTREGHGHIVGDPVDISRSATDGYYEVHDTIIRENPNLFLEDCVNGGRFLDFGVVKRNHYICLSDDYTPLGLRRGFYDATYPLPPSMCEQYLEQLPWKSIKDFVVGLRSAMLGWCTIMIDISVWSEEQHAAAKREFDIYKEKLRPLIANADIYHVLPRPDGKNWDAMQYFDPETGKGVLYVFRPQTENDTQIIKLYGFDSKKNYWIESEDGSITPQIKCGKELVENGLSISLPDQDSSDLIFITEIR